MSDLKPCPFCGGEASIVSEYAHGEEFEYVECNDCLTRTDSKLHLGIPSEIWNTRHSDPDMVPVPREPTRAMKLAAHEAHDATGDFAYWWDDMYKAMIQAWENEQPPTAEDK